MHLTMRRMQTALATLTGLLASGAIATQAFAQDANPLLDMPQAPMPSVIYPDCQAPTPKEYLLLVVTPTADSMETVQKSFPPSTAVSVCTYQETVVTRVGGFTSVDSATSWVGYLKDTRGLTAYVVRPLAGAATPSPSPAAGQPAQPTAKRSTGFDPQPLGMGYAVLVDFQNRPELALKLQQATGRDVGLVTYRQRPYLLATYTTDQAAANTTLQSLTDGGFWAMVVDGRRVILLRQEIDTTALKP